MTQDQLLILLLRIILISGEVTTLAFVVQYTRLAPWWRTPIGRRVVIIDLLLAAALVPSLLSLFFNFSRLTSYVAAWVDVVLLGLVTPVMLYGIWVWEKIHRHGGE